MNMFCWILSGALQLVSWGAIVMHPSASSSIAVLTGVLTLSNMGAAISEVMNDALVAEAGKRQGARQGEQITYHFPWPYLTEWVGTDKVNIISKCLTASFAILRPRPVINFYFLTLRPLLCSLWTSSKFKCKTYSGNVAVLTCSRSGLRLITSCSCLLATLGI